MNCRCAAVGWSLLGVLWLAPGMAVSAESAVPALRLGLAAPSSAAALGKPGADFHIATARPAPTANRRGPRFVQAEPSLRQRALESVFNVSEQASDSAAARAGSAPAQFQFERQGSPIRNLQRGYQDMCAKVTNKLWDEPNGRRVKFDVAGKPGVAVEIPLR